VKQLQELQLRVESAMERLNLRAEQNRLEGLDAEMLKPDFWSDSQAAARISQEAAGLRAHVESWVQLHKDIMVARELDELGDETMLEDLQQNLVRLSTQYAAKEFELKLSGPHDRSSAILSIYAGTGGTD